MNKLMTVALTMLAACGDGENSPDAMVAIDTSIDAPPTAHVTYIKASNAEMGDYFGTSMAFSADGHTLVVGAPGEDGGDRGINGIQNDNLRDGSGAVYVYALSGPTWAVQAYIKSSNSDGGDAFGASVAISADGNTIAVGANWEKSAATGIDGNQLDNSKASPGAVYVFTRTGNSWVQTAYVKPSTTTDLMGFGGSVALSADGNLLVVGAIAEGTTSVGINGSQIAPPVADASGSAYIFRHSGTTWSQEAYVKASNTDAQDHFGAWIAVAGDGRTVAIGASGEASDSDGIDGDQLDDSAPSSGAVYVFTRVASTWGQEAYLKATNSNIGDSSNGIAIALSHDGSTLAFGVSCEAGAGTGVDGNQGDNTAYCAGAVYSYGRTGTTWTSQGYLKASNTDPMDNFGKTVTLSMDGRTLAVGAPGEESGSFGINGDQGNVMMPNGGAVYVFTQPATSWMQTQYIKAPNKSAGFGSALGFDTTTSKLAVAAAYEGGPGKGVDPPQVDLSAPFSGAVYLVER